MHVDIILNDVTASLHRCVGKIHAGASLHLGDSGLRVELAEAKYAAWIPPIVWDHAERRVVRPELEPARYLDLLQHEIAGSVMYATAPHEPDECMFRVATAVPFGPPKSAA